MHSRIYQISKEPIVKDDYVSEDLFYDEIFNHVADYVTEETNREDDINWLVGSLSDLPYTFNQDEKSIVFHPGFKEAYFESDFIKFKSLTANMTLDSFSNNNIDGMNLYRIIKCINDKFGFYTIDDDNMVQTMDEFIRDIEENTKYFIGGTLDYHF